MRLDNEGPGSEIVAALMRIGRTRELGMFVCLGVLFLVPAFFGADVRTAFYAKTNLSFLLRHIAILSIFAIGETFVIISGGIDLSVGSVIAFCGVACGYGLVEVELPVPVVIPAVLLLGALVGLCHGFFVVKMDLQPFVATLGTMCILRSLSMVVTESLPITIVDDAFLAIGEISGPVIILVPVAFATAFVMHFTIYGRYLYAVGSNEEATRLSGVNAAAIKTLAYVVSSFLAAGAGIVYAAYAGQGDPSSGVGYELNAIAAAVIGGCTLGGGEGSVLGTLIGSSIFFLILNELNLIIPKNASLWEGVIVGVVVIAAVTFNTIRHRRASQKAS